ncbi:MAG: NUDIX hydrolase [Anaerolineales bacterium]|nr:NUDIX hydrolase [Anaerolineales bacterium]
MSFKTLQSSLKFSGRVFSVNTDQVLLPDGQTTTLDVVIHGEAVVIIPVDADGGLWFVRQYRYPAEVELVELPAGAVEADEDMTEGAQRELREEIGYAAAVMEKIGTFYLAPGYSTERLHIFLARELTPAPLARDVDEFLQTEKYSQADAYAMVQNGTLQDAKTLAALLLARPYLSPA